MGVNVETMVQRIVDPLTAHKSAIGYLRYEIDFTDINPLMQRILQSDLHDAWGVIQGWRFGMAEWLTGHGIDVSGFDRPIVIGYDGQPAGPNRNEDFEYFEIDDLYRDGLIIVEQVAACLEAMDRVRDVAVEMGWEY